MSNALGAWRWWFFGAIASGAALSFASLDAGLAMEDHYQRWVVRGSERFDHLLPAPLDTFTFLDGDAERTGALMDLGVFPWWTDPQAKAAFWRPLAAMTQWLDYHLFTGRPWMMHAHSIVWYGLLIGAVGLAYRRISGAGAAAGLAVVWFAVDEAHAVPVGFLANRNALMAGVFGMAALMAHLHWRRDGGRWGALFGPAALALSLLSAEAGVGAVAYLIAWALTLDRAGWRSRLMSLLPYVAVVAAWRVAWAMQGYGVSEMVLYIDPLDQPWSCVKALAKRAPLVLAGQWTQPPAEGWSVLAGLGPTARWVALALVVGLAAMVWPLVRRDRTARFWAMGMLLAVVSVCTTLPHGRQLTFVGIGAFALMGLWLVDAFRGSRGLERGRGARRWMRRAVGGILLAMHLLIAPVLFVPMTRSPFAPRQVMGMMNEIAGIDAAAGETLVIVNHPLPLHAGHAIADRDAQGLPIPGQVRTLASGMDTLTLTRDSARRITLTAERSLVDLLGLVLQHDAEHLRGRPIELPGLTVRTTRFSSRGHPIEATFRFDRPLNADSLHWVCWRDGRFEPFTPPPIGESATLQAIHFNILGESIPLTWLFDIELLDQAKRP